MLICFSYPPTCLPTHLNHPKHSGWEEYLQRVFNRYSQLRSKKDGSLPKPHWAKWQASWVDGLAPYIKEVRLIILSSSCHPQTYTHTHAPTHVPTHPRTHLPTDVPTHPPAHPPNRCTRSKWTSCGQ